MSKVKDIKSVPVTEQVAPVTAPPPPAPPPPNPKLLEEDRLALELAKSRRETALAQAKEALAKNETAEIAHKYVVMQIYMKYGLNGNDSINQETGEIIRGGALLPQDK